MSTKADGTVVNSAFAQDDLFAPPVPANGDIHSFSTSSHGSTEHSPTTDPDLDQDATCWNGDVTPRALKTLFDDNFGPSPQSPATSESPPQTDDIFSFQAPRGSPSDDRDGGNSSNVLNALSLLERSFGRVTVTEPDQEAVEKGLSEAMSSSSAADSGAI